MTVRKQCAGGMSLSACFSRLGLPLRIGDTTPKDQPSRSVCWESASQSVPLFWPDAIHGQPLPSWAEEGVSATACRRRINDALTA